MMDDMGLGFFESFSSIVQRSWSCSLKRLNNNFYEYMDLYSVYYSYHCYAIKLSRGMKKTNKSKMICAPSEDSDQPGHPPSLIRVFAVRMKKPWVLSFPLRAQQKLCWFCRAAARRKHQNLRRNVHTGKSQTSLHICTIWSESLMGI